MVDGKLNVVGALVLDDRFFSTIVTSCLSLSAAVDVLIAIAMTYLLLRMRNATGFANTAHILQRLIVFAVNTGTWTALFAVLSVVLLRLYPSTFLHALPAIPLCSLYCNTLLANLNARAYVRDGEATPVFDNTNPEKQNELVFSSPHQKTTVVAFMDASRFTTAENSV
ncbi:hypothetical protein L210DRAFT_3762595 [Boletus edulis BED1]|uniref:DUF6534 domain-containing protein n=1 Tax=Boletus edulis BED1 TaxID=1328754 RepID=A0AAD4BPH6_BOLED|nr:hypothetical protein L210DRAFT_3762595 [Boletus edulis BED1]